MFSGLSAAADKCWIAPSQSEIAPNMQSCASPGLFFSVTTDGNVHRCNADAVCAGHRDRATDEVSDANRRR